MTPADAPRAPADARAAVRFRWLLLVALLATAGFWFGQHHRHGWRLLHGDEMEYADVGRRLAAGRGFTTGVIYPAELAWGVGEDHPSLVRPPFWPLALGGLFAVFGVADWVVHLGALIFHLGTTAAAMALAMRLGGLLAAAVTGAAVATSPQLWSLALVGGAETVLGTWIVVVFLLLAREADGAAVGAACALAYLTRYNGGAVLPVALWLLARRADRWRAVGRAGAAFALVCMPWWVRNLVVAGNPLFSLYNWTPWVAGAGYTKTPIHLIEPRVVAPFAVAPLDKARVLLPELLRWWPPASANLAACVGVLLGCVRRDRLCQGFAALAAVTTVGLAFSFLRGRYFVPLLPLLLALGPAAWVRYGSRLRLPGLALVLAAPLLPAVPAELNDMLVIRYAAYRPPAGRPHERPTACLPAGALIVSYFAAHTTWAADTRSIWMPATPEDLRRIVDRYPIEYVYTKRRGLPPDLRERFVARPDCGPALYQRRTAPGTGRGG